MLSDFIKTCPQFLMPKKRVTTLAGQIANCRIPWLKNFLIRRFIKKFQVDMTQALEENIEHYNSFNDFFIRHLKPQARPIANATVVSPVDGVISEIGSIHDGRILQAKGHDYQVESLLASPKASVHSFLNGQFMTLYLSPKDYHRVHMPISAQLREMVYVPGRLFSVQPATVRLMPNLFAKNERIVAFFDTDLGPMAMVMVGATIVGSIATSWDGDVVRSQELFRTYYDTQSIVLNQGDEMGYFKLGSTVIMFFAEQSGLSWREHLQAGSAVQYGEAMSS